MADLDNTVSLPLYRQLAEKIKEEIYKGTYKQDQQIPTEIELCSMYSVSRSTVRKAIEQLANDRLLIKIHGKGTFVAPPVARSSSTGFVSHTKAMQQLGKHLTSRVLSTTLLPPTEIEKDFFQISQLSEKVITVQRLRCTDDTPMCIETIFLPMRHLSLLQEDFSGSFYQILRDKYNIYPSSGYRTFEICHATKEEAALLNVSCEEALILIRDYVHDQNGDPLHISKRVHSGNTIQYGISAVELTGDI